MTEENEVKEETTKLVNLFESIIEIEEEIKDQRTEIKEAISIFCEENEDYEKKAVKAGLKFFKSIVKDRTEACDVELQRDKIVEAVSSFS